MSGDGATVTTFVRVTPEVAFAVFTEEIDAWWRTGPQYRVAGRRRGRLFFEPKLGGRLFETFEASSGARTVELGTVLAWDPPRRFELEWRGVNFAPGEKTFVEVAFEPLNDGTKVTVRHRGFSALRDGHPVRHGKTGADFSRMIGLWWGGLATAFREHAEAARGPS
ncbi:MAG: SRPBCC domain-containing protein [Labilithrix sp.]|nr:SRPBCC domain-containing protein [Labilithrix sp.]MCW5811845.1 SRPBCC domain-containing protein [Labilithrix sp.]